MYDRARQRTVLVAGRSGNRIESETWEWDGSSWTQRFPAVSPPAREHHAVAYDEARQRVVLFGGDSSAASSVELDDTWEWDGTNWVELSPAQRPEPRANHGMAYDRARGRVVLFGGARDSLPRVTLNDTWEWDGTAWTQLEPSTRPAARNGHSMAYDAVRQRVVLFGGQAEPLGVPPVFRETWEWDGTDWSLRSAGTGPEPLRRHPMTFDAGRQRTVLFEGWQSAERATTWEWDGSAWSVRASSPAQPASRYGHAFAYDPVRQRTILFAGVDANGAGRPFLADTWAFDGAAWTRLSTPTRPSPRALPAMVWDGTRQRLLLYGGFSCPPGANPPCGGTFAADDTWEWDGTGWSLLAPAARPPGRYGHRMAYDSARQRVVLFGGRDFTVGVVGDTWEWDGSNWMQRHPELSPTPREGYGLAYDPARQRVVLFGGGNSVLSGTFLGDTWEWDGEVWRRIFPPVSPRPRLYPSLTWDPTRQRVVLLGGESSLGALEDQWEWDGAQWTQVAVVGSRPPASQQAGVAFDAAMQRTVLFGGQGSVSGTWWYAGTLAHSSGFGVACPGSRGAPSLLAFDPAALGRASFALDLTSARAGAACALLLAGAPASIPVGGDCAILVDVAGAVVLPGLTSAAGAVSFPLPLPSAPSLLGMSAWSQAVVVDPAGAWQGLALSAGVAITLGH